MNPLSLTEAYNLYQKVKPHLPKTVLDYSTLVQFIVRSIAKSEQDMDLIEILAILNNTDSDTILKELIPDDALSQLMQGFLVNSFIDLVEFFRGYE